MLQLVQGCGYLFETLRGVVRGVHPDVGLHDHASDLVLIFCGATAGHTVQSVPAQSWALFYCGFM